MSGEHNKLQFMQCTNQAKTPRWAIGFVQYDKPYHKLPVGQIKDVHLVLIRGLVRITGTTYVVYHLWKGEGYVEDVYSLIDANKNDVNAFVCKMFYATPIAVDIRDVHISFVNQIPWEKV
jgi:hypothetical protein